MMSNVIDPFPAEPLQTVNHNDHINRLLVNLIWTKNRQKTLKFKGKWSYDLECAAVGGNHYTAHRVLVKMPILFSKMVFLTSFHSHMNVIIEFNVTFRLLDCSCSFQFVSCSDTRLMLIHFDHPEGCHLFYNINVYQRTKVMTQVQILLICSSELPAIRISHHSRVSIDWQSASQRSKQKQQ